MDAYKKVRYELHLNRSKFYALTREQRTSVYDIGPCFRLDNDLGIIIEFYCEEHINEAYNLIRSY